MGEMNGRHASPLVTKLAVVGAGAKAILAAKQAEVTPRFSW